MAIALVIVGHYFDRLEMGEGALSGMLKHLPFMGVALFFAISGFIITRLLTTERQKMNRIHVGRFYARRAIRLWPALSVFILAMVVLSAIGVIAIEGRDVFGASLFLTDYVSSSNNDYLFHTWSLGVEEQFYLIWPILLILAGVARDRRFLILAIACAPLVRLAGYVLFPEWRGLVDYQFHDRYDALAFGCLLAVYWDSQWLQTKLRTNAGLILSVAVASIAAVEFVNQALPSHIFGLSIGYSIESAAFAALVGVAIVSANAPAGRLLNSRTLVHLGLISYSLYLWQQMFVLKPFSPFSFAPFGLLAAFACAELSWHIVERPLQSWRQRLHPAESVAAKSVGGTDARLSAGGEPVLAQRPSR